MREYFNCHNHTMFSNIRLVDSINRPQALVNKAIELGLSGIAITDHECISSHVIFTKIAEDLRKKGSNFKIALGNEIYLIDSRNLNQKYYHFILIAKDSIGHKALRELSSTAWYYSYTDRGQERVPTEKKELEEIVSKYKGHLIATTACIGGELSSNALLLAMAEKVNDQKSAGEYKQRIDNFIQFCLNLFGDDFYIECAPSTYEDQKTVNKKLSEIAQFYGIKMVVGTDSHYLTAAERPVHKAYLNSKNGEREVDSFYEFTYLMDSDEIKKLLGLVFTQNFIEEIFDNTLEIQNKVEQYSLFHKQDIPSVEVKNYPPLNTESDFTGQYKAEWNFPYLDKLLSSDDIQDRYWVNQCLDQLKEIDKYNTQYLTELEEEARVKSIISEKLETNMFRYPNTLQHYIDMIWESGSMVGAGRGSSCAALNHYLMGITQLDPIEWNLPFFRYLNEERIELGCLILILPSCK